MPCMGLLGFIGIWPDGMPPGPSPIFTACIAASMPGGILCGIMPDCSMPACIGLAGYPVAQQQAMSK